jgi:DNA-binding transcriptional regulator GbsR (MarR family)
MRSSNLIFLTLLFFVSCNTELLDTTTDLDLENIPAFIELSAHPVSQAFFSAVSLRMRQTAGNGGFQKVMALINELIANNKLQVQKIRKINARVEGECMVTAHKLKDRSLFFAGQKNYFHARGSVSVEEKGEALNVMTSRNTQKTTYNALLTAAKASHERQDKKWGDRISNAKNALSKVTNALTAVNEWTPKTSTAFVQQLVKESVEMYTQVKNYPLTIPSEMVQLAANDVQIRNRLFQWLTLLKGSIVENLAMAQSAKTEIDSLYDNMRSTLEKLNDMLTEDAKKLSSAIENYTTLIKVYAENEKIYSNLSSQNDLLVQDSNKWCNQEVINYKTNHSVMEAQLKVFTDLRFWLRKNFSRVRDWLKKTYK